MAPPSPDALPFAKRTILLVDDEEAVREVAARLLAALGCDVITARDGSEAVSLFLARTGPIDLALVDLTMPRLSGDATLRELRRLDATLPLALMSGYPESDILPTLAGIGLVGYLQKPFRLPALREMLKSVLGE